ncbi:MAG: c-type cytochrome domain-containing protein [Planctomycetota bacterium]
MLPRKPLVCLGLSLVAAALNCVPVVAEDVSYVDDVVPILETYCTACHTEDDPEGGLVLTDFAAMMSGGESGLAVTSGVPSSSRLLLMAAGKLEPVMPPDGEEGPNDAELEILAKWIEQGAKGPDGEMPIKKMLRTPTIEPATESPLPLTAIASSSDASVTARASFGRISLKIRDSDDVFIEDTDLGKVNALAFSPDDSSIAAASGLTGAYGRVAIYDVKSGELKQELLARGDIFYSVAFHPTRPIIAAAGYDRIIRLWNVSDGQLTTELRGHNGAIFDLAFSPDGLVLASACADETVKLWSVQSGDRLDTLGQPEGEVYAVAFSMGGKQLVAASADNRVRVWQLRSVDAPAINPLIATRFVDESPLVDLGLSPDGMYLVTLASSGSLKLLRTSDWQPVSTLEPLSESGTDLFIDAESKTIHIALMNGRLVERKLPTRMNVVEQKLGQEVDPIWMDLGEPSTSEESSLRELANVPVGRDGQTFAESLVHIPRNVLVQGSIDQVGQVDHYAWTARRGEVWAIDVDAESKSRLDPFVSILDAEGQPVTRVRLQAVRDSYFTFRGKNSDQVGDFRIFNWQEMKLGEFLYAAGEVTKLHRHPRGPDSGFNVFPGEGQRWTYFGTSGTTHALGEPAYIVRPLSPGVEPLANGLPVFDLPYENDDDPMRLAGKNARLLFTAPTDGTFVASVSDTRGEGGDAFKYELRVRPATPSFKASCGKINKPIRPSAGREFSLTIDRIDGFEGEVTVDIQGLPVGLQHNFPVTIEAGQRSAVGMVWASKDQKDWKIPVEPRLIASATIGGRHVERPGGSIGKLTFDAKPPSAVVRILPAGDSGSKRSDPLTTSDFQNWTLQIAPGQTVSAVVALERLPDFDGEVSFGKEEAGRNASHGVYVDNIGLNGLLILAGAERREFFITADETAKPGKRTFFLKANFDGGITSHLITIEVIEPQNLQE